MVDFPVRVPTNGTSTAVGDNIGSPLATNYPSGSVSGDLLICGFTTQKGGGSYDHTTPDGWNALILSDAPNGSGGSQRMSVFWRFRGAETSVSLSWTTGTALTATAWIVAYQGDTVHPTTPVQIGTSTYANSTGATVTASSITTTVGQCRVLGFATSLLGSSTAFTWSWSGGSELLDFGVDAGNYAATSVMETSQATAGATGSFTATSSTNTLGRWAVLMAVRPNPIVTAPDTASATENASVDAELSNADTAAANDAAVVRVRPASDTGSGSDVAGQRVNATETALGNDAVSGIRLGATEIATADDNGISSSTRMCDDAGTADDSAAVRVRASDAAAGAESEYLGGATHYSNDTAVTADTAGVRVGASDTAASSEVGVSSTTRIDDDTATAADTARIIARATDSATAIDIGGANDKVVIESDPAVANDVAKVLVRAADTGSGADDALRLLNGADTGNRVAYVRTEDRTADIDAEDRTADVRAENRTCTVGVL